MWTRSVSGYLAAQTETALHAARRTWGFRYDLLDQNANFLKSLSTVYTASVSQNAKNAIRRTAQFQLADDQAINILRHQIRPWARLLMPDGGYAEWPLGTFLLSTPPRKLVQTTVVRDIAGYDYTQILQDDRTLDRYTVAAGTPVTYAIGTLLSSAGIARQNIQSDPRAVLVTQDWPIGTPKLKIVSELLASINYTDLWFDALGVAQAIPYVVPSFRPSEYTYQTNAYSVILSGAEDKIDVFGVPNVFVLAVSKTDRPLLRSVYTNTNPLSKTSTASRGRNIVSVDTNIDAVDQTTLNAIAQRTAYRASQIAEEVILPTGMMPFHANEDVVTVMHAPLGLSDTYVETAWTLPLKQGAAMNHVLQRIITV